MHRFFFSLVMLASIGTARAAAVDRGAIPIHGVVIAAPDARTVILDQQPVPLEAPGGAVRYAKDARVPLKPGDQIDALAHGETLSAIMQTPLLTPGLPDPRVKATLEVGDRLPNLQFVDQSGRVVRPSDWLGKTVVLSFVYSRCPDLQICPAISGKFAYLQHHLDPMTTQLVEITVDPQYDSPAVLARYGAQFGADNDHWLLLGGEQNQVGYALGLFGLSNLRTNPATFVHDDTLAIIKTDGTVAQLIPTVGWAPDDVIASVEHASGGGSNPVRRWELAMIAGVVSLCGGSITTGVVMLDSFVFVAGVVILGGGVLWFGHRIWRRNE